MDLRLLPRNTWWTIPENPSRNHQARLGEARNSRSLMYGYGVVRGCTGWSECPVRPKQTVCEVAGKRWLHKGAMQPHSAHVVSGPITIILQRGWSVFAHALAILRAVWIRLALCAVVEALSCSVA